MSRLKTLFITLVSMRVKYRLILPLGKSQLLFTQSKCTFYCRYSSTCRMVGSSGIKLVLPATTNSYFFLLSTMFFNEEGDHVTPQLLVFLTSRCLRGHCAIYWLFLIPCACFIMLSLCKFLQVFFLPSISLNVPSCFFAVDIVFKTTRLLTC